MSQPHNPYDPNQPYPAYGAGEAPYGAGGPGYARPADHPQATAVLILGILSFVVCQVLGPVAWVMGGRARREIAAAGGRLGGQQMVTVGWALGIVSTVLLLLGVLVLLAVAAIAIGSAA